MNKFKELGTYQDHPRSGRLRTACTQKVNPKRSARKMGKNMNVSVASMITIFKNNFKFSLYKMRKR